MANTYVDAVTKTVDVNGTSFVYRETGQKNGIPLVLLHHPHRHCRADQQQYHEQHDNHDPRIDHDVAYVPDAVPRVVQFVADCVDHGP